MKITGAMLEIINHRLGCGLIGHVLADNEICTEQEAESAESYVQGVIKSGEINLISLTDLQWQVFSDALEGCTFFANSEDAVALKAYSRGKLLSWHRAANSMEQACFEERGERVSIPRW